jgi:hypothetical protein
VAQVSRVTWDDPRLQMWQDIADSIFPLDTATWKAQDGGMSDITDTDPRDADADWRVMDEEYWLHLAVDDDDYWADERAPELPDRLEDV